MDSDLFERIHEYVKFARLDQKLADLADLLMHEKQPQLGWAFLYSNTVYNKESIFGGAAELQSKGLANSFLMIGSDDDSTGFPGYTRWSTELEGIVGTGKVKPVPLLPMKKSGRINVNNLSESESLVDYAAKQGIPALYVVAWNVQQLRAVATGASVVIREESPLTIVSHSGTKLPWAEVVLHSQGRDRDTRANFVGRELDKIVGYQAIGDIRPTIDIIRYLEQRKLPA